MEARAGRIGSCGTEEVVEAETGSFTETVEVVEEEEEEEAVVSTVEAAEELASLLLCVNC